MKKKVWMAAVLAMVLGTAACSNKTNETTAAPETTETTEAVTEAAADTEEETEEVEEDYLSGIITAISDQLLTVKSDDDESEKQYDISNAELVQEFPLAEGDWVEITFPFETTEDPVPVIRLEVLDSVIAATTDPSVEGVVEDATMNTLTLKTEDGTYSFTTENAYVVAENGVTVGETATVTYLGDLDDTDQNPLAVKVVMADSYDSEAAQQNAFIGSVAQVEESSIVLESAYGDFFTFVSDEIDFSAYQVGDNLKIFYTGTIAEKAIPAVSIEKQ